VSRYVILVAINTYILNETGRSPWQCGLKYRYAAVRLLGSRIRIPLWAWMFLLCLLCVLQVAASEKSWLLCRRNATGRVF